MCYRKQILLFFLFSAFFSHFLKCFYSVTRIPMNEPRELSERVSFTNIDREGGGTVFLTRIPCLPETPSRKTRRRIVVRHSRGRVDEEPPSQVENEIFNLHSLKGKKIGGNVGSVPYTRSRPVT